ncbi:hypothetical protein, partial [Bacillus thuringiensis]|uniref:hypothetical protein n=1 Tax=Bacillus thuringiensis TaxID=1428 RepID=UPI00215887DB
VQHLKYIISKVNFFQVERIVQHIKKLKMEQILPAFNHNSRTTTYSTRHSLAFLALPITSYVIDPYGTSKIGYATAIHAA